MNNNQPYNQKNRTFYDADNNPVIKRDNES